MFAITASAQVYHINGDYEQLLTTNIMKYWKARGRLTGDPHNRNGYVPGNTTDVHNGFLIVGPEQGMSIPPEWRIPDLTVHRSYDFESGQACYVQEASSSWTDTDYRQNTEKAGEIGWGDGTVALGHYIAMLAIEYQLLHRARESTANVEQELYYALKAIDRLDMGGEAPYGKSATLNGFMLRDDVPWDFAMNYMGKQFDLIKSDYACPNAPECEYGGVRFGNAMSYDQVTALIMGLAIVDKLFDGNNYQYNGEGVLDIVGGITDRIISYCSKKKGWILVDPNNDKPVCRGPAAGLIFSYPLSVAGRVITGDNNRYRDGWSQTIAKVLWSEMKKELRLNNPTSTIVVNLPGQLGNLLGQNSIFFPIAGASSGANDNITMILQCMVASRTAGQFTWTPPPYIDMEGKMLINRLATDFKKEIYDLYGSILIGFNPKIDDDYWRYEFQKLPCACNCVQSFVSPFDNNGCPHSSLTYFGNSSSPIDRHPENYPWVTSNRWEHWTQDAEFSEKQLSEFPGIDYLEAFAGYMYKYHANLGLYNRLQVYLSEDIPNSYPASGSFPTNLSPFKLKSVFDIASNAHIYAPKPITGNPRPSYTMRGEAEFTAGSSIRLDPPFTAEYGTLFTASIGEYDCAPTKFVTSKQLGHSYYNEDHFMYKHTSADSGSQYPETGIDTFSNWVMDTTVVLQQDSLTYFLDDTAAYDTSMIKVHYSAEGDTVYVGLGECYDVNDNNDIIYICDENGQPQGKLLKSLHEINLYPNPANDLCHIQYTLYEDHPVQVYLANMLGQDMSYDILPYDHMQGAGTHAITINVATLPRGMYSCEIWIDSRKVVKKLSVY